MPKWNEYVEQARDRGNLALELFTVESTPCASPAELKETLPEHLEYQNAQEAAGALVMAGPLSDDTGDLMEGAGLIVYRATSLEDARKIADADPMHAKGRRTYRLRRWLVNEGCLEFTVKLSQQSAKLH